MKSFIAILGIFISSIGFSQNISGVWSDSSSTSFTNCTAIFAVDGDSVFVTHYLEFNGQPFVEYGSGTYKNGVLDYSVKVVVQIPGWSTAGIHHLELSADGRTLRGTYEDNADNTGELVLKKIYPIQKK